MSQQFNLYNPAFVPPREVLTAKSLAIATLAALVLVSAGAVWAHRQATTNELALANAQAARAQAQAEFDAARQTLAGIVPNAALKAQVDSARARIALRERILAVTQLNLAEPGGGFSRYLIGLARQTVPGLWLDQVGIDASGQNLSLGGQTVRQEAVPDYVRRLSAEPAFAGKSFAGMDMAAVGAASGSGAVSPAPTSAGTASSDKPILQFQLVATRSADAGVKN